MSRVGVWKTIRKSIQAMHRASADPNSKSATVTSIPGPTEDRQVRVSIANSLLLVAAAAYDIPCDNLFASSGPSMASHLSEQWHHVELPMWQEVHEGDRQRMPAALRRMGSRLERLLDADGWPMADAIADFGLLAASWTRCLRLAAYCECSIDQQTESLMYWVTQQLLRSTRTDGSLVFADPGGGINGNAFRRELLRIADDRSLKAVADHCLKSRPEDAHGVGDVVESSISEWAQVGVLRSGWFRNSPLLGVKFNQSRVELEMGHRCTLVRGDVTPKLHLDGELQTLDSEIGVSCHLTSDEIDYVELQLDYGDVRIHRQLLLLRSDALLMVADNVASRRPTTFNYRCTFPLGNSVSTMLETETNEHYLCHGSHFCLVVPLFLPEWKTAFSAARLWAEADSLTVSQSMQGRGFWLPVVFDLNPRRSVKPRTWRNLTVAERRRSVSPDVAAAYRLQVGRKQWLFYRAVTAKGNRTFLGQNSADEFFVGSISINGTVKSLLEVE